MISSMRWRHKGAEDFDKQPYLSSARQGIHTPLHNQLDFLHARLYGRSRQLCSGHGEPQAAVAAAAVAVAAAAATAGPRFRRDLAKATAASSDMQDPHASCRKTTLLTVGFADAVAEVLPQHTVSPLLQDRFHIREFPVASTAQHQATADYSGVASKLMGQVAAAVVAPVGQQLQVVQQLRAASPTLFIVCWHPQATEDAAMRWQAFHAGANMVTHCRHALATALHKVSQQQQLQQQQQQIDQHAAAVAGHSCTCDWCGLPELSAAEYWMHQQLYHINHDNKPGTCQVCGKYSHNLARHLHDSHDPAGRAPEERTGVFALAIVRRPSDGKFLMTQEFAGSGFWVPGGGVDPGESLVEGALRECREEAGVDVVIRGILDLGSHHGGAWRRVIFLAEPTEVTSGTAAAAGGGGGDADGCSDDKMSHPTSSASPQQQQRDSSSSQWHSSSSHAFPCCSPKTLPDWESAGACWVSAEELSSIPLRSASEPCRWFPLLAGGLKGLREQLPLVDSLELPQEWAEGVFKGFPCQLIVD